MVDFKCKKCNINYNISKEIFKGYLNWKCPECGEINPPSEYTGYTIKGCENTKC